jgi:hypothetical protein
MKRPICQAPASLQKLLIKLSGYNITLVYKPGKLMHIADTLSRAYIQGPNSSVDSSNHPDNDYDVLTVAPAISPKKLNEMQIETANDKTCQAIMKVINTGWPQRRHDVNKDVRPYFLFREELTVQSGIIYKGNRVLVPNTMRHDILQQLHSPHVGVDASQRRARETVFWDTINADLQTY